MRTELCPISTSTVGSTTSRLAAAVTMTLATLFALTGWYTVGLLALAELLLRSLLPRIGSPVTWLAKKALLRLGLTDRPVNAAPKRFAATLGMLMMAASLALELFGATTASLTVGMVLAVCAGMEAIAHVCIGCHLYSSLATWGLLGKTRGARHHRVEG